MAALGGATAAADAGIAGAGAVVHIATKIVHRRADRRQDRTPEEADVDLNEE